MPRTRSATWTSRWPARPTFITALQLDTKIEGIPADVLAAALDQAKEARTEILANMNACIAAASCRGCRDRSEDHLDHHPDGQDR